MLVKCGPSVTLNMTGIDSVLVRPVEKVEYKNPLIFSKGVRCATTTYDIEIKYRNSDGKKDNFTISQFTSIAHAMEIKDEILSQAKEIENVGATQALEEAIKNA